MDDKLITALISASVSLVVAGLGYWKTKRSLSLQARRVHESVTEELIKQRIDPYTSFLSELEQSSNFHCNNSFDDDVLASFEKSVHTALYGKVGLLASHETRQLLVYTRIGCDDYRKKLNGVVFDNLLMRRWALLVAIRSDLGIVQPAWDDALRGLDNKSSDSDFMGSEQLVYRLKQNVGNRRHYQLPERPNEI